MTFEILKCEGWGRSGQAFGKSGFVSPNIVTPCFFNNSFPVQLSPLKKSFKCQKNDIPSKSHVDLKIQAKRNNSELFPLCFIYPSLQSQGKSLEEVSCFNDMFPVNISGISDSNVVFHLIPWDLPTIYLDRYDEYLETLNQLNGPNLANETRLMLNLPFSREILDLDLPAIKSPSIAAISLGDISSVLTNPRLLIRYLKYVKKWISPNIMLYAPGIPSSYIPILVYLGIDLFDLLILEMYSAGPTRHSNNILEQKATKESYLDVLDQTKRSLENGRLRELTRIFSNSFPPLKAILRIIDSQIPLEEGTPLYGPRSIYCTDETDFTRPEVTRFRERVQTRYTPPSHYAGIIFLPCSAKKPYSKSKSHGLFQGTIRRVLRGKRHTLGEIILTSPLGVVPRELEYSFPAAHYDIPVTGEWSEIERNHLSDDISNLLTKLNPPIPLVGYVCGAERGILKQTCHDHSYPIHLLNEDTASLTSKEALKEFSILLQEAFSDISSKLRIPSQLVFLRVVADFQFGRGIGKILIPDQAKIYGRKDLGLRVQLDNEYLLTFRPETGYLTLSLAAGKLLLGQTDNVVTFDGQKIIGSTIFSKSVINANSEIRPRDEVFIINKEGELLATGISHLPGDLLIKMNRGKGITLRQKVK